MARNSQLKIVALAAATGALSTLVVGGGILTAVAQQGGKVDILDFVTDKSPKVKVNTDEVTHQHLVVRRIDIVDDKGVIRMTLAGELPNPVVDGIEYKRNGPVSGLILRDDKGNERGGYVFHSAGYPLLTLDHINGEAVGMAALPDGATGILLAGRAEIVQDPRLDGRIVPASGSVGSSQIRVAIDENGAQEMKLTDTQGRARLTLNITEKGHGEIRFLDAEGKVVNRYGPETQ